MKKRFLSLLYCLLLCLPVSALAEVASPAPAGDLSFLSGYADAVRVGDWFLACVKATRAEAHHDSATRNTTAEWVLLDKNGDALAEGLYWWPKDVAWPLHPRPFEGFEDGVDTAVLRIGQKYGLIDRAGNIVVDPVYDEIFGIEPGDTSTPVEKDGKWGCVDAAGRELVPPVYDDPFSRFENGCTVVKRNGKAGLLGEDGREILPTDYDVVYMDTGAEYGFARKGGRCMLFDHEGAILFEKQLGENGWIFCYADATPPFAWTSGEGICGYCGLDGADNPGGPYEDAQPFWKGRETAGVQQNGLWGEILQDGSFAVRTEYQWVGGFSEGLAPAQNADGLYGYLDASGAVAIPFAFSDTQGFDNGYADASPREDESLHGLIDPSGRWVIEPTDLGRIGVGPDGVAVVGDWNPKVFYRLTEDGAERIAGLPRTSGLGDSMRPHEDASALAKLSGEKTLKKRVSEKARLPRLDGNARLYPLYAAYVEAVYPKDVTFESWDYGEHPTLTVSGEDNPWERLLEGDADIIFVPAPDPDASLWATLAARGLELEFIPLCRDAVVFPVHADNPVEDVTREQLRQIYAGELDDWADLGGGWLGGIVAYQDDEAGREAFERLCGFGDVAEAPMGVIGYDSWLGDALCGPVPYRNLPNAVGYALRAECGGLLESGEVRLLSVDGVAPTDEHLLDGSYPFTETLYAVTLKGNDNPNVAALLDWIQSEQGRELAEKSGFAAMG